MADKKFSEFTPKATPTAGDELVGTSGADNIRVPIEAFATGAEGDKANTAVQDVAGTAPIVSTRVGTTETISITAATGAAPGSMSAADKTKLDAISGTNTGDVTVTDSATIDLTLTGQDLTASVAANSIGSAQLDASTDSAIAKASTALQTEAPNDGTPYSRVNTAGVESWVKPDLNDLDDVVIAAPQNSQALIYDAANSRWINQDQSGGGGGGNTDLGNTPAAGSVLVTSSTGTDTTIAGATASLAGVLSAADKTKLDAITGTNTGNVTVTDTATIDLTITGQALTAAVVANSIGSAQLDAATDSAVALANTAVQPTIFAAKGDLLSATANDTPTILSAGTAGQVLTVNTATATGLEWAEPSGGAVSSIVAGGGIAVNQGTGAVTVTNTGSEGLQAIMGPNNVTYLICWGDSNMGGAAGAGNDTPPATLPITFNPNVLVWSTLGTATGTQVYANCQWRTQDPNAATVLENIGIGVQYFGIPRGGRGNIAYYLADKLQKQTKGTVCLMVSFVSGSTMSQGLDASAIFNWQVGGGYQVELNAQIAASKIHASAPVGIPTVATAMVSNIGVNDVARADAIASPEASSQQFVTTFTAFMQTALSSGWVSATSSRLYHIEPSQTDEYKRGRWLGAMYFSQTKGERTKSISTFTIPMLADNIHFTGDGLNMLTRPILADLITGPVPKDIIRNPYFVSQIAPKVVADFDANFFDVRNVKALRLRGSNTGDVTFTAKPPSFVATADDETTNLAITKTYNIDYASPNIPCLIAAPIQSQYIFKQNNANNASAFINLLPTVAFDIVGASHSPGSLSALDFAVAFNNVNAGQTISQILQSDMTLRPTFGGFIGAGSTWSIVIHTQFQTAATYKSGITASNRISYMSNTPTIEGTGVCTNNVGFSVLSNTAVNNTHFLGGATTPTLTGNFNMCQMGTYLNRFNGPIVQPIQVLAGTGTVQLVKGVRSVCIAAASTETTITLPTKTSMETGHAASTMAGYELVITNDKPAGVTLTAGTGTTFNFGGAATYSLAAGASRTFIYSGATGVWY